MAHPNKEICKKICDVHKEVLDEIFAAVKGELPVEALSKIKVQRLGVSIDQLVSCGILSLTDTLYADAQDGHFSAILKKATDGNVVIQHDGSDFETPTGAAKSILKREVNGWTFWYVKDGCGQIKGTLADLREKFVALQNQATEEVTGPAKPESASGLVLRLHQPGASDALREEAWRT